MVSISTIRKNSWILIVLIGLGMLGFLVMDMTSGQGSIFGGPDTTLGKVAGQKINIREFDNRFSLLYQGATGDVNQQREQMWSYMVEEVLVKKEAEALGLEVGKDEMIELMYGPNFSPIIQRDFRDPQTGRINMETIQQIRTGLQNGTIRQNNPQFEYYWMEEERQVYKDQLQTKLGSMVAKAIYTPTWMAEMQYADDNTKADFAFVKVPFDVVDNSEAEVSDADITAYLKENRATYERKTPTVTLEYIVFDVLATKADTLAVRNSLAALVPDFAASEDDSLFVFNNEGSIDATYYSADQLNDSLKGPAFSLALGQVYGPYLENGIYKIAKVRDRKAVPDSVQARHILIQAEDAAAMQSATRTIDSLKTLIETGVEGFDSLALKFGQDATATKGGDLGVFAPGMMVKPFNDLVFYEAEPNKLYTVQTQFGVHLVEVTRRYTTSGKSGVQLAFIERPVVPSEATQDSIKQLAYEFVNNNRSLEAMKSAAEADAQLELSSQGNLPPTAFFINGLGGGEVSRNIVKWAYGADKGDVSPEVYTYTDPNYYYNNKFVLVGLAARDKAGLPSASAMRAEVESAVRNRKKAELLQGKLAGNSDLAAIASTYGVDVDTASAVAFSAAFVPGVGNEPKVVATAFSVEANQVSAPIAGNSGVFVIKPISKIAAGEPSDLPTLKQQSAATLRNQTNSRLMPALREAAKVDDKRASFF